MSDAKKEARAAKRAQRKQQYRQFWQAFNMQRKQDKALLPIMLATVVGVALAFFLIGLLWGGEWFMLIIGIMFGILAALWVFTRRMERNVYAQAEGQPGAAAWAVENLRSGPGMVWRSTPNVEVTPQLDAVHRVVGLCGVVLISEGDPHRVKSLLAKQRKRISKIVGNTPVYEIHTGTGEGEVPLAKLQRQLVKLPRNIKKNEMHSLATRLESIDRTMGAGAALPKGPIPKGARVSGMNRRMKRAQKH